MYYKKILFYILVAIVVSVPAVFFYEDVFLKTDNKFNVSLLVFAIGFGATLYTLVYIISNFLESSNLDERIIKGWNVEKNYKEIFKKIDNFTVEHKSEEVISNKNLTEATNLLRDKLENISAENYFQEFKKKIKNETVVEILENKINNIELRVQGEISRLSRSGIINLSLGMMLSIGGILYLGSFVVNVQTFDTLEKMFVNTFPKAIFVLLIEVFAYFFLKLYKQNLDDIKYYQNELTNIESKNLAVQIAKQSNNHKLLSLCVEEFLGTERNFILEKDQSTIEIEKERINSNNNNNLLMALKDMVKPK